MELNNDNYFSGDANKEYMSVSQFKAFEKCQAAALAELQGNYIRERSTALLIGSYIDTYFEGMLDEFKKENPQIFKRDGNLKSDYVSADNIINRLNQDKLFMDFMDGEKQVIMTGEINGVPIKIKMDSYHPNKKIVDLKIMRDFKSMYVADRGRLNWVEAWRYDLQGAIYQEIVRQNTGKRLPFFICAATKESEPDIVIIEVPQSYLDLELRNFSGLVQKYDAIKKGLIEPERCEKCDYCKKTKVLTKPVKLGELDYD